MYSERPSKQGNDAKDKAGGLLRATESPNFETLKSDSDFGDEVSRFEELTLRIEPLRPSVNGLAQAVIPPTTMTTPAS